jgi:hypothetical protein
MPNSGTDAHSAFDGIINLNESASYNSSSSDWSYKATFTGLDPSKTYEFVTTANRNGGSYSGTGSSSRWTKFSLIGADAYTNASSSGSGVIVVSADVIKMNTGYNTVEGNVVKWTGIQPGTDGSFVVLSQNVGAEGPGESRKSYGLQGFILTQTSGASTGGNLTVNLLKSDNITGLSGGNVYYYKSGWQLLGTTNSSGTVSGNVPVTSTTDIEIRYIGGKYKWVNVDVTTNPTLTINTVPVTVKLETCDGVPLVGEAKYYFGGFTTIGSTPAMIELLPYSGLGPGQGNYDFRVEYDGRTSPIHTQDIAADPVIVFKTTKVTLFGSDVKWYNGGWQSFTSPKEVIGGTSNKYGNTAWADFKFDGNHSPTMRIDIDGCSVTGGILTLVDEAGNPLANYPADYPSETRNLKYKYRCGGSWAPWTAFQTDANGQVFYNIDCSTVGNGTSNWDNKITMTLNQTSIEQDVSVNSVFQAAKVNVNLQTCNPTTPLPGGTVAQGGGYWYTHGTTGTNGVLSFYAFPNKNVKVRMNYNYGSNTINSTTVTAPTTEIDFTTTTVNIFGSSVKIGVSGWPTISMPIELLPNTYNFKINGNRINGVEISGCEYSGGLLTVKDENGNPVEGASFSYACGGSWVGSGGNTDANGQYFGEIPACMTKIDAKVGNSAQEQTLAQLNASNYTFSTEILRINLKDHAGNPITDQTGSLAQGGGSWIGMGDFNASGYVDVQTFPTTSARYRATYNCNAETKNGIAVTAGAGIQEVDFQTGQVVGPTCTQYQGCGWSAFTNPMEQLPGTRTFRFNDGTPQTAFTVVAGQILTIPAGTYTTPKIISPEGGVASGVPEEFKLYNSYPNPFNPSTTIVFTVKEPNPTTLKVYNTLGQEVAALFRGTAEPGRFYRFEFDASDLASGLYIYRLESGNNMSVKKMMLLK